VSGDDRLRSWAAFIRSAGAPTVLALLLLFGWKADRAEERLLRAEQHTAMLQALGAVTDSMNTIRGVLESVESKRDERLAEMRNTVEWIRGTVAGKLHCPPCAPARPCPLACPPPTVQVPQAPREETRSPTPAAPETRQRRER
jgi:hypothetical protein